MVWVLILSVVLVAVGAGLIGYGAGKRASEPILPDGSPSGRYRLQTDLGTFQGDSREVLANVRQYQSIVLFFLSVLR